MKPKVVLGLNAGTSADGVDLAAIRFSDGRQQTIAFLGGREKRYTPLLKETISRVADARQIAVEDILYLDQALGSFYGKTAATFIKELKRQGITVDLVASHGQTVRHRPKKVKFGTLKTNATLQLGSLERVATETDKITVGDFRQADIALGNEGAPITVAAMEQLFARPDRSRLIVNIGGIANYFYFPAHKSGYEPSAADCGPGNSLCDILSTKLFDQPFDKNGRLALSGNISHRILTLLGTNPFFRSGNTSTGRELFGPELANQIMEFGRDLSLAGEDMMATAAAFTVRCIITQITPLLKKDAGLSKLYLTGGGFHNKFFRDHLDEELSGVTTAAVDDLGIPSGLVEASAYAVMGRAALLSRPLRTVYGNRKRQTTLPVLGKIAQPPLKVRP